jgi:transposase InsO family protein
VTGQGRKPNRVWAGDVSYFSTYEGWMLRGIFVITIVTDYTLLMILAPIEFEMYQIKVSGWT